MRLLLLCVLTLFTSSLSARNFYVLLAADTITEVRKASKKDLMHMRLELKQAADAIGANLHIERLYGKHLTAAALRKWIFKMPITHDDVLLFYYTGHGFRTKKSSTIWPYLYLPAKAELVDTNILVKALSARGAGLSIILADCCNNFVNQSMISNNLQKAPYFYKKKHIDINGYKKLFQHAKGVIIASGSIPGKRSWATSKGGIFTNAFLSSLRHEVDCKDPAWERVLIKTKVLCSSFQKPQYQMQVNY